MAEVRGQREVTTYFFETITAPERKVVVSSGGTAPSPPTSRALTVWPAEPDTMRFYKPLPPFVKRERRKDWLQGQYRRPRP